MTTLSCPKKSQTVYRRRRPEKTPLFETIKKHYATWHKDHEASKGPVPNYIDNVFQKYLECGILAKGFACAHCRDCNKDFFIAFSCKARGICPSCNTHAMVQTAAHLVDEVLPRLPFRQFVISFPMRIRYYLQTHTILQSVLKIVVDEIRKRLTICNPNVDNPQIGAISFIQQFGNTLNYHPHFHLVVADGVFNGTTVLQFHEASLTPDDIADTQDCIQKSVLGYFCKRGFFNKNEVEKMLSYENSGFSLDANVRIQSWDKDGLERLIRYCARPPFKSENIRCNGPWINYRLPKPSHAGKTFIQLEPLEFIDRISNFIPYPRRHRHHYHGVFASNSPLRKQVAANAQKRLGSKPQVMQETAKMVEKASRTWAQLIARIYEINPLICTTCGKKIKIIAFITHSAQIRRILSGIGWPIEAPEFDPAYDIITWDICQLVPDTHNGFPEFFEERIYKTGPDPPYIEEIDPPHCEDIFDPPHWED
jgi:hypothetical protein